MTPTEILDSLDATDATDESCAEVVDRLVTGFDDAELRDALRGQFGRLEGARGAVVLRLVEAYADEMLGIELAEALTDQPSLPPDRAWEALMIVQGLGLLDAYPELAERLDEIDAIADEGEVSLDELAAQLEEGEENLWIALQGLSGIEPPVRVEIVRGLAAREPMTRGIVALLRLLAKGTDAITRDVAVEALGNLDLADMGIPALSTRETARWDERTIAGAAGMGERQALVSSLDSTGRGLVIVSARSQDAWPVAVFTCDVMRGIIGVSGVVVDSVDELQATIAALTNTPRRHWVDGMEGVATALLAGSLMLGECEAGVQEWLRITLGSPLAPQPIRVPRVEREDEEFDHQATVHAANAVLEALPEWVDESAILDEFAEEFLLRDDRSPDPERNSGAYRFLFENQLLGRLELDRRMLIWMAIFWRAGGDLALSDVAVQLAEQLADEQNAVPGHPFIVELTTRSLLAAQRRLEGRTGDPAQMGRIAGERGAEQGER
jgi:hypothetical protein